MLIGPLASTLPSAATAAEGIAVASGDASDPGEATPLPTRADVEAAVTRANDALASRQASLQFQIDPDTHAVIVRLVDTQDHRVLRQVPSEEMLAIARAVDRMQLTLLHQQA